MDLKEARKKAGMSMEELGRAVGVSSVAIWRYEHGERVPKVEIAKRLGKLLGFEWYRLMDNDKKAG